jgi:hypothetical protein
VLDRLGPNRTGTGLVHCDADEINAKLCRLDASGISAAQ